MLVEAPTTSKKLVFNDIKSKRHTTSGVFTDEEGNTFTIDVKGTNYDYVNRFLQYQLEKNGEGISTSVVPLTKEEVKVLEEASKGDQESFESREKYEQGSWHGLCVTVQVKELQEKYSEPQRVRITIDPVIEAGESSQMNFQILGQEMANVLCTVTQGKVTCELFEFTNPIRSESTLRQSEKHITTSKQFDVAQLKTGGKADWNFRVIGELKSTFTLALDLKKM